MTRKRLPPRDRKAAPPPDAGFTLVELLVVLAIVVLIAGIAAPQVLGYLGSARADAARTQIRSIESALELFYIDHFRFPTTGEGLAALAVPTPALQGQWNGPYLKNAESLKDPWGRPYIYENSGQSPVIASHGRDGLPEGDGQDEDITNASLP